MISQDRTTSLNNIVNIIGIFISIISIVIGISGIIGFIPQEFFSFMVDWNTFSISASLFLAALLMKRIKKCRNRNASKTHFVVQLSNPKISGLLPKEQRVAQIQFGKNPYIKDTPLLGNSALFYGRKRELHGALSVLRNPDKPGNVSILGERHIGKSSLLNQINQALMAEENVITIYTTMKNWRIKSQADFFRQLRQSICKALKIEANFSNDYESFRDFIAYHDKYRFILLIDEFDKMMDNTFFDAQFFSNIRALGEQPQFGYVLASRAPLHNICHQDNTHESKFWNIFGTQYTLGLLTQKEAEQLIQEPMQHALGKTFQDMTKILDFTGYHPAFIQLVAADYYNALYRNREINHDAIKTILHNFYQELWQQRTEKERELLRQIANHKAPKENYLVNLLRLRGLLNNQNKLFAHFFEQMILDSEDMD
ncbi:ATP-binding protein [Candidatus Parabeggiatoa sp. HSG14]|uniref:ATP-binding protein n=1 Tax=Candidatus Parabeggiatoa sp. HSG14 TaxID=3055593 RepID=UPI0025A802B6|nr:ATP-binding protein [Thiotrichales bacterium HSG14]